MSVEVPAVRVPLLQRAAVREVPRSPAADRRVQAAVSVLLVDLGLGDPPVRPVGVEVGPGPRSPVAALWVQVVASGWAVTTARADLA